jgi:hypothetical protein
MTGEFNWWLLIVGVVAGAGLTWLVLADSARREREVAAEEVPAEAEWIARVLADEGVTVAPATAEAVLLAHRRYLASPPPDALVDPAELDDAPMPSEPDPDGHGLRDREVAPADRDGHVAIDPGTAGELPGADPSGDSEDVEPPR